MHSHTSRVLILGTGLAGLSCALKLAESGIPSTLVTNAADPSETNTAWAQGGVAYINPNNQGDNLKLYIDDIFKSGDGIGYMPAIEQLAHLGNRLVREVMLEQLKIDFDRNGDGKIANNHEGAHSISRVIHVGDATGKAIHQHFLAAVQQNPLIELLSQHTAVDLLTTEHHSHSLELRYALNNHCCGAYLLDNRSGEVKRHLADFTVLATGGVGQLFLHSTNSPNAIGSGMVMASRAGARLLFPHYIQFHPTALYKGKSRFLISEVVRGAGAQLLNARGERFMQRYNPQQLELAPRDELTRAISQEMLQHQDECVYLDLTKLPQAGHDLAAEFPTIFAECLKYGIDIRQEPIPVVPAAHYHCGGVKVDLQGRTTLSRLFAIGEVSCTGVHGANRLASTSLVECLTWGHSSAAAIAQAWQQQDFLSADHRHSIKAWEETGEKVNLDRQRLAGDWSRMRTVMWNYVGILRSRKLLDIAAKDFNLLSESLYELYFNAAMSKELVDLFHGIQACRLIVEAARKDPVSLGCHYLLDASVGNAPIAH